MRSAFRLVSVCFALVVVLGIARPARAETIDFRGLGLHVANLSITVGSATGSISAGELNWAWMYGTPAGYATNFFSYCVDAVSALRDPQVVDIRSTSDMASSTAGAKVAWLFNRFADEVRATGSNVRAAALQVAIWEAVYDTSNSLTGGSFRLNTTGAVRSQAASYLSQLYSSDYTNARATWLDTSRGQDQITRQAIPEPSTLLLVGCASVLLARRRRKLPQSA
jgi:PEP-CTERM motif